MWFGQQTTLLPGGRYSRPYVYDMCNGRFGLVRHRFGRKQFCCKACLDSYLSDTMREAHRSRHWLDFLARKE